jgi:hypothetical protein
MKLKDEIQETLLEVEMKGYGDIKIKLKKGKVLVPGKKFSGEVHI